MDRHSSRSSGVIPDTDANSGEKTATFIWILRSLQLNPQHGLEFGVLRRDER